MKKFICFFFVGILFVTAGFAGEAKGQDTCYACGDFNGDGYCLSVTDLVHAVRFFSCDAPSPDSNLYQFYQIDFNADCVVDTADLRIYEGYWIYGPSIFPRGFPVPTCCDPAIGALHAAKGDVNADGEPTPADVVLLLTCTFAGTGGCGLCEADLNCDFELTPADVVLELTYVFQGGTPPGCP